jgi:hypothetical protein
MAGWQPLSGSQLTHEMAQASEEAHRLFSEITQRHHASGTFNVRTDVAAIMSQAGQNDIMVIVDPRHPLDRVTRQFRQLIELAFVSTASVLIVPSTTKPTPGQLVAVGTSADDPGISTAIAIAASTKEPLTIVPLERPARAFLSALERARRAGVRTSIAEAMPHGIDALSVASSTKGRLLVASRQHVGNDSETFSRSPLLMPLLLVQPGVLLATS